MEGTMRRRFIHAGIVSAALLAVVATPTAKDDKDKRVSTRLVSYEETPSTINSTGSGDFTAKIQDDGASIEYQLTYRDLSSSILQSHIHFGRPALTGGIVLFLCTNLTPPTGVPAPQKCPTTNPATITGTLTAADVIPLPNQGIDSGPAGFAEMVAAIDAGAAYVNVHTTNHPSGEIRGRLRN
jgi:hypothetical protein